MRRRALFLCSKGHPEQTSRVVQISSLLGSWNWTAREEPMFRYYDVVWVLDQSLINNIKGITYRVLVCDESVWEGRPLPEDIADVSVSGAGARFVGTRFRRGSLEESVALEICEDILDAIGGG